VKHEFKRDADGGLIFLGEQPGWPYCLYIECARCGDWFCHNGCDGDVFNEECNVRQLDLFPVEVWNDRNSIW
jgi:hypothetical protein